MHAHACVYFSLVFIEALQGMLHLERKASWGWRCRKYTLIKDQVCTIRYKLAIPALERERHGVQDCPLAIEGHQWAT